MERLARWASRQHEGLEHLVLRKSDNQVIVESVVIGERENAAFGLHYRLMIDSNWHLRSAALQTTGNEQPLILHSDGAGHWMDDSGAPLSHFTGCIDIDISATPFTNTLPIRRLGLSVGGAQTIQVIYIPVPSLIPELAAQRYTRLAADRFRYEGLSSNFCCDLPIDADGLVLDYPETFRRLAWSHQPPLILPEALAWSH